MYIYVYIYIYIYIIGESDITLYLFSSSRLTDRINLCLMKKKHQQLLNDNIYLYW